MDAQTDRQTNKSVSSVVSQDDESCINVYTHYNQQSKQCMLGFFLSFSAVSAPSHRKVSLSSWVLYYCLFVLANRAPRLSLETP